MAEEAGELTRDTLLGGRLVLLQPRRGHRAGTDAVLLAGLDRPGAGETVVDLGAGTGAVGLMAALRAPGARALLVEREPALAALCRRNVAENALSDRVGVAEADLFTEVGAIRAALPPGGADLLLTNPPFFEAGAGRASPEPGRRSAHHLAGGTLADWLAACAKLLAPRGRLGLIHRADALSDVLAGLAPAFGSVAVTPVHAKPERDAVRVLVTAVRGGRAPLRLRPASHLGPDGRGDGAGPPGDAAA